MFLFSENLFLGTFPYHLDDMADTARREGNRLTYVRNLPIHIFSNNTWFPHREFAFSCVLYNAFFSFCKKKSVY